MSVISGNPERVTRKAIVLPTSISKRCLDELDLCFAGDHSVPVP
jgi:hypothetical protein